MVSATRSLTVASGRIVIGSRITPDSYFLTARTSRAWASSERFLWTMPMPPSLGQGDGETGLGDGVHGRGDQRNVEVDVARQARLQVDFGGQDLGVGRQEEDVIECQGFVSDPQHRDT